MPGGIYVVVFVVYQVWRKAGELFSGGGSSSSSVVVVVVIVVVQVVLVVAVAVAQ